MSLIRKSLSRGNINHRNMHDQHILIPNPRDRRRPSQPPPPPPRWGWPYGCPDVGGPGWRRPSWQEVAVAVAAVVALWVLVGCQPRPATGALAPESAWNPAKPFPSSADRAAVKVQARAVAAMAAAERGPDRATAVVDDHLFLRLESTWLHHPDCETCRWRRQDAGLSCEPLPAGEGGR